MIIEDRSINDLIMKLSVRKNIGLDAAKRNKDALVEYAVQKTRQKFKNIGLDCNGYTFQEIFFILILLKVNLLKILSIFILKKMEKTVKQL